LVLHILPPILKFLDSSVTGYQVPLLSKNSTEIDIAVAYVKNDGVALLHKSLLQLLKRGGHIKIVVAIDPFGITDGSAVANLYRLLSKFPQQAEIRYYRDNAFHPKLYIFKHDNKISVIIGSSNLTRSAMESNIEANLLIEGEPSESAILALTDYFDRIIWTPCQGILSDRILTELRHYDKIKPNVRPRHTSVRIPASRILRWPSGRVRKTTRAPILTRGALPGMVLIRYIPRAAGRVAQVHFTREIVERYFRLQLGTKEIIRIQRKQLGKRFGKTERRTLVYSIRNKNPKIEVEGAKVLEGNYPTAGRPIIIFQALINSRHRYMIRLPGDEGYMELARVLANEPRKHRALPYKITDVNFLKQVWPSYR